MRISRWKFFLIIFVCVVMGFGFGIASTLLIVKGYGLSGLLVLIPMSLPILFLLFVVLCNILQELYEFIVYKKERISDNSWSYIRRW